MVIPVDFDGRTERVEITASLLPLVPAAGITPSGLRTSSGRVTASGLLIPERTTPAGGEEAAPAARPKQIARITLRLVNRERSGSGE